MKIIQFAIMAGAGGLMAACAPQSPARVVDGMGRTTSSMVPMQRQAAQVKHVVVAQPKVQASALMADEQLAAISPAAGEIVPAQKHIATPVFTPKPVAEVEPTMVQYRVAATDTAYKLARKYNTSVERILKDNGLAAITDIREGQDLTIAQNSKPQVSAWDDMKRMLSEKPQAVQQPVAQVQAVKTVEQVQVAKAQLIEPKALAAAEKQLAAIEPAAGERPKDNGVTFEKHTVQPKETIYRISLQYNVSVLDIMAANDFAEPQDLKADTVIKVPMRKNITQQLAANVAKSVAEVAPAAGDAGAAPVIVEKANEPVQVAMLGNAPVGAKEAQNEDLETKAVKQQAQKDAALEVVKDITPSKNEAKIAEAKRGYVDAAAARSSGLVWPVKGQIVRRFGDDGSGIARTGINIAVPKGTPVLASEGGKVLYADEGLKIYGKMVLVRHDNGMVSAYAHNSYLLVKKNERVKKGQVLALSGASGNVESPQLHFELRQHASAVDPVAMLPRL